MLLTLDLATTTGFCVGVGDIMPEVGHVRLPPPIAGDRGPTFLAFRRFLLKKIDIYNPSVVVFEAPILPKPLLRKNARGRSYIQFPTNIETTTLLQGLAAIVELECAERRIECEQEQVSKIKRELAGRGNAEKGDMVFAARKLGFKIEVHDEADAVGIWLLAVRNHAKQFSPAWDRRLYSGRGAMF